MHIIDVNTFFGKAVDPDPRYSLEFLRSELDRHAVACACNHSGSQESEFRIQNKIRKNQPLKTAMDIPPRPCVYRLFSSYSLGPYGVPYSDY